MAEYIKREDIGLTDFEIILCKGDYKEALKMLLDKIENSPVTTIPERKKGIWKSKLGEIREEHFICYTCSECGRTEPFGNYCRHCGAAMDGVTYDG